MNVPQKTIRRALAAAEAPEEGKTLRVLLSGHGEILLCRVNSRLHAVSNTCSHSHVPLHAGRLDGYRLTCPLHGASFDVRDGRPLCEPAKHALRSYHVHVSGEYIYIEATDEKD